MSVVHLYATTADGSSTLADIINERIVSIHSCTVETTIKSMSPTLTKVVTIAGAAPAVLRFVTTTMKGLERGQQLYLRVWDLPIIRRTAIYEAVEAL